MGVGRSIVMCPRARGRKRLAIASLDQAMTSTADLIATAPSIEAVAETVRGSSGLGSRARLGAVERVGVGRNVFSDPAGRTTSADNPVLGSVTSRSPDQTSITNTSTSPTVAGFNTLAINVGMNVEITAPQASTVAPLSLTFTAGATNLPAGSYAYDATVFREGSPVTIGVKRRLHRRLGLVTIEISLGTEMIVTTSSVCGASISWSSPMYIATWPGLSGVPSEPAEYSRSPGSRFEIGK